MSDTEKSFFRRFATAEDRINSDFWWKYSNNNNSVRFYWIIISDLTDLLHFPQHFSFLHPSLTHQHETASQTEKKKQDHLSHPNRMVGPI